ncbi:MAG: hypothetical protein C5B43_04305 [Verrucomicrobia bacterium]|nr:MAG: hypothetical protein C5B43_04305 [Verrucomicrobiota bacterium]
MCSSISSSSNVKTVEDLMEVFKQLNISVKTTSHKAVFTTTDPESDFVKATISGAHSKNLFLKSKKGKYYLVSMLQDKRLNVNALGKALNSGSLSFTSDPELMSQLSLMPGHVTPFAVINNLGKNVQVILDKEMMEYDLLNFHPLRNDMTTTINSQELVKFLKYLGYDPLILALEKKD